MNESVTKVRAAFANATARAWPVAFLLVAVLLRTWHVDHMSIWQDEGLSFYRATLHLPGILSGVIPLGDLNTTDTHPPFYFLLLAGWFKAAGVSPWSAKWLSVLAGLPTIPLVWAISRRTVGAHAAVGAALMAALAPIYLWYAQEVRSYTLTVTLGLLAVYALRRAADEHADRRARLIWGTAMVAATAVLLWTHYLGFFVVVVLGVMFVVYTVGHRGRQLAPVLAGMALIALAAAPLLPNVVWRLGLGPERDQHLVPLPTVLYDVVRGFGVGRTFAGAPGGASERVTALLDLAAGALALSYALLLSAGILAVWRRSRKDATLLASYLLVPVVGLYALTLIKPVYLGPQHILLASPPFFVLVGAGLSLVRREFRPVGFVAGLVVVTGMSWAALNFYADPTLAKDDLRGLVSYVDARAVPGDLLAVSDPVLERSLEHLATRVPVVAVPRMLANGTLDDRPAEAQLAPLLLEHGRVWFMTPLEVHQPWLEQNALRVDREGFHGASIPVRVDAYELDPSARRGTMPPRAAWDSDPFLGELRLKGWEVVPTTLEPGAGARVRLVWQALGDPMPDYKVAVRLLDARGRDYASGDHEPYHGEYPTSEWPIGELTYEPHDLLVSPAAPPGEYRVAVSVYDPETGDVYPPEGSLVIGTALVGRPDRTLGPLDVAPGHRLSASGGGVELLGYDLVGGRRPPGALLPVTLWWRAVDENPQGSWAVDLVDRWGRTIAGAEAVYPDESGFELTAADFLRSGDLRRTSLEVGLPASSGTYGLRLRHSPTESPSTLWIRGVLPVRAAWLGNVVVDDLDRQREVPIMDRSLQLDVGEHVAVMGYDAPPTVVPGEPLDVALYWRARDAVPVGYHVTVQLVPAVDTESVEPSGPPVAQHDGVPAEGSRPMTGWLPGEIVADRHSLMVPADLPQGRYLLIAALYDPAAPDQPRPVVAQDGVTRDYVLLDSYEVPESGQGGFTRDDGRIVFGDVLDLGEGGYSRDDGQFAAGDVPDLTQGSDSQ